MATDSDCLVPACCPGVGKVNPKGLAFYDRLVDEATAAGVSRSRPVSLGIPVTTSIAAAAG